MATSLKYQQDIGLLISKNEKVSRELEVMKAKYKEAERQATHSSAVQEALNRKIMTKDSEINQLAKTIEKLEKAKGAPKQQVEETTNTTKQQVARIKELEAVIAKYQQQANTNNNAFGILQSSPNLMLSPGRRVSHLSARPGDCSDWLEPLIIAEHVLNVR